MQTDAPFWDSLVFDGFDDVDVEALTRGRAACSACPDARRAVPAARAPHTRFTTRLNTLWSVWGSRRPGGPELAIARSSFQHAACSGCGDTVIRSGQTYSTVLTSLEDHRVVDVLPTR
ncbi:hypothetical protein ACFYP6_13630 [Streptomyces goshikiensis]|uniref:hypothetical protein n=1 Tax=Streptomyces goshikiensis TaxID=1942 RepID=UPI00369F8626